MSHEEDFIPATDVGFTRREGKRLMLPTAGGWDLGHPISRPRDSGSVTNLQTGQSKQVAHKTHVRYHLQELEIWSLKLEKPHDSVASDHVRHQQGVPRFNFFFFLNLI